MPRRFKLGRGWSAACWPWCSQHGVKWLWTTFSRGTSWRTRSTRRNTRLRRQPRRRRKRNGSTRASGNQCQGQQLRSIGRANRRHVNIQRNTYVAEPTVTGRGGHAFYAEAGGKGLRATSQLRRRQRWFQKHPKQRGWTQQRELIRKFCLPPSQNRNKVQFNWKWWRDKSLHQCRALHPGLCQRPWVWRADQLDLYESAQKRDACLWDWEQQAGPEGQEGMELPHPRNTRSWRWLSTPTRSMRRTGRWPVQVENSSFTRSVGWEAWQQVEGHAAHQVPKVSLCDGFALHELCFDTKHYDCLWNARCGDLQHWRRRIQTSWFLQLWATQGRAFCFLLCLYRTRGVRQSKHSSNRWSVQGTSKTGEKAFGCYIEEDLQTRCDRGILTTPSYVESNKAWSKARWSTRFVDRVGSFETWRSKEGSWPNCIDQAGSRDFVSTVYYVLSFEKLVQLQKKPRYSSQRRTGRKTSCWV